MPDKQDKTDVLRAPGTVREFRRRLHELHAACGEPANAEMRRAICGFNVPQLAPATLSEFVRDIRPTVLPRQDFVRAFVAGCLLHSKATPEAVGDELNRWDAWWIAVVTSSGQPPITVITPQESKGRQAPNNTDDTQDSDNTGETASAMPRARRPRRRTVLLAVGCALAGFVTGALSFGWYMLPVGEDPSLRYGPCAEQISHSRTIGQTVLLFDRGPHSKPIQDRRIELRTQNHPKHGWILWAHLAETPSTVDRLWLDWSYQEKPDSQDEWRQCGAQPISDGPDTPALLARDSERRPRWFRACGQVYPAEQRAPDAYGSYCTSWTRPQV